MSSRTEERRTSERIELDVACVYVIEESTDTERFVFHQGAGKILNMSGDGMLLLLDRHPRIQELVQVHLDRPRTGRALLLLEVCWTRPVEDGEQCLAGCKLLFGPYSTSLDKLCPPTDLLSP